MEVTSRRILFHPGSLCSIRAQFSQVIGLKRSIRCSIQSHDVPYNPRMMLITKVIINSRESFHIAAGKTGKEATSETTNNPISNLR